HAPPPHLPDADEQVEVFVIQEEIPRPPADCLVRAPVHHKCRGTREWYVAAARQLAREILATERVGVVHVPDAANKQGPTVYPLRPVQRPPPRVCCYYAPRQVDVPFEQPETVRIEPHVFVAEEQVLVAGDGGANRVAAHQSAFGWLADHPHPRVR